MIACFGDSYCDLNPHYRINHKLGHLPWPVILGSITNTEVKSYGVSGSGLWHSYRTFLEHYRKYDTVIYCYAVPDRWNSIIDEYSGLSNVREERNLISIIGDEEIEIAKALIKVFPYLYNYEFNTFIYQKIFDDVNILCKENNIKLVNIIPFENLENDSKLRVDITKAAGPVLTNLSGVSSHENIPEVVRHLVTDGPDQRFCHLNPQNNKVLAETIVESLNNNIKLLNLFTIDRFSYDEKYLLYLLDKL